MGHDPLAALFVEAEEVISEAEQVVMAAEEAQEPEVENNMTAETPLQLEVGSGIVGVSETDGKIDPPCCEVMVQYPLVDGLFNSMAK